MSEETLDPQELSSGLKKIRQRRWILWVTILIYVPAMMLALQSPGGWDTVIKAFIVWIVLLCIAVGMAVVVRCPDCGNCFHTHGPTFMPVRRCVHCGLHVLADKRGDDRLQEE
jgi:ribosomal protein S27E